MYADRREAGQKLARKLTAYAHKPDTLILALPRGGVPVAFEIAQKLKLPFDVMLVRKLGVPGYRELAMGAIAAGVRVLNEDVIRNLGLSPDIIEQVAQVEQAELERRNELYRDGRPPPDLRGKTVILVDDGMATGANMRAAVSAARRQGAKRIIIATPVGPASALSALHGIADEIVCPFVPDVFYGVGGFYDDFRQTGDEEVIALLSQVPKAEARHERASA